MPTLPRKFLAMLLTIVAGAADAEPSASSWPWPIPDREPTALLTAFIQADAWGLQSSGHDWPLVKRFTTWEDGPGWDRSAIVESAEIVGRKEDGRRSELTVRYRKLAELSTDGAGKPVIDETVASWESVTFVLEKQTGTAAWRLIEPQDGPRLSVGYALDVLLPRWCGPDACRTSPAYRLLSRRQQACPPSPIPLNRTCAAGDRRWRTPGTPPG